VVAVAVHPAAVASAAAAVAATLLLLSPRLQRCFFETCDMVYLQPGQFAVMWFFRHNSVLPPPRLPPQQLCLRSQLNLYFVLQRCLLGLPASGRVRDIFQRKPAKKPERFRM